MATGGDIGQTEFCDKTFTFQKFNSSMDFILWLNYFEYIAKCHKVEDHEMTKYFLDRVEFSAFMKIKEQLFDKDPYELPYDELTSMFIKIFVKIDEENVPELRLVGRVQFSSESIEDYVLSLRKYFSKCNANVKSSRNLTKLFVEGLRDDEMRKTLINFSFKNFSQAVALAIQMDLQKKLVERNK